jgi:hypothetical protein
MWLSGSVIQCMGRLSLLFAYKIKLTMNIEILVALLVALKPATSVASSLSFPRLSRSTRTTSPFSVACISNLQVKPSPSV